MRLKLLIASAGLASLAAGALPAIAGDWNHGAGAHKSRASAAVPVPAPVALFEQPSGWYIRLDAGIGQDSNHGFKERGLVYGAGNTTDSSSPDGSGFGSAADWLNSDKTAMFNYGIGVGYNWGHNWRSDVTIDRRSKVEYRMRGSYQYTNHVVNPTPPQRYALPLPGDPQLRVDGTTSDNTSMKSGVLMANGYYDWKSRSPFTPYVGMGLGLAYVDLERLHTTTDTTCDTAEVPLACFTRTPHAAYNVEGRETKLLWAAAAHAGFTYDLTASTALDINYRLLYIPGTSIDMRVNGNQSRVTINDTTEHQLRAGLRWNIH